mgnify:CR=1 FL=1
MIIKDLNQIKNKKFSVIIIGSGLASLPIAIKLEKSGIETLMLEAGKFEFDDNSTNFLKVNSVGDHVGDFTTNRSRQFGGSSRIWGGNCNPMNSENFSNWPINKKDLDKYTDEASKFLLLKKNFFKEQLNNNLNIYNLAWSKLKIDENYYNYIKKSKLIHLSLNSTFINFENSKFNKSVDLINCKKENKIFKLKAKFFVLAAGGFENSRLLLWSRSINKNLFSSSLPIGKYYMHHPYHYIGNGFINYKKLKKYFKKNNIKNIPIITCESQMQIEANSFFTKQKKITNSGIYLSFDNANENNDLFKQLRCFAPKLAKNIYDQIKSKEIYDINISTLQEQNYIESNFVSLSDNLDPNGLPLAQLFWKKQNSEIDSCRTIIEEIAKIFINEDIGRIVLKEYLFNSSIKYDFISGNHQMGGTRMGIDENDSVVDENLKVHGIENLFIAGSSVFKTSGHCHPTFTIVQLSLRLADNIIKYKS